MTFAQLYECSHCGDVWRGVEIVEVDCGPEDTMPVAFCCCGREVRPKYVEQNGNHYPVMHALSDEEIWEEQWEAWAEDDGEYDY